MGAGSAGKMKCEPGYVPIYRQPVACYPRKQLLDPKLCGEELHRLSEFEIRLLGESALALWHAMLKLRVEPSNTLDEDWYPHCTTSSGRPRPKLTLCVLAEKAKIPFRRAKRALRRLRECGVVTTRPIIGSRRADFIAGNAPGRTRFGVQFTVWGAFAMYKDHTYEVFLPREKFLAWAANRAPWGGHREDFWGVHLAPQDGLASRVNDTSLKPEISYLDPRWSLSYNSIDPVPLFREFSEKLRPSPQRPDGRVFGFATGPGEHAEPVPLLAIVDRPVLPTVPGAAFDDALYAALAGEHKKCRPVLREPTTARPVLPPLDPVPTERSGGSSMSAGMTPAYYAGQLVSAYRQAVQSIYGQQSNCYRFKGITEKSKHFGFLLAAAQVMVEEEIAPATWALWWMRKLKTGKDDENVSAFAERPPPMRVIFAQSTLRKHHGWFHHDAEDSSATAKVGRVHLEQMYRHREATNIWRGMTPRQARLSTESWYDEMREEECKMGHEDPLDFYPRATAGSC